MEMTVKLANRKEIALSCPEQFVKFDRGFRDLASMTTKLHIPKGLRGFWFCGEPGTSKSRKARELCPNACLKSQNKWWDGCAGEDTVISDDCDTVNLGLLHLFKIWTDRCSITGKTKGSTVPLQHDRFIVTSNWRTDEITKEQTPDSYNKCHAVLERRFKKCEFKKEFIPPDVREAGPCSWVAIQKPTVPDQSEPFD